MNQKNTAYKILIAVACALALATAIALYFAQTVGYDISIEHFARDSASAVVATLCVAASVPLAIAAGFLCRRGKARVGFTAANAPQVFSAAVTAFMLFASFILNIRALATGLAVTEIFRLVLTAFAAAWFFLAASREKKSAGAFSLLSLCPLLYALVSLLTVYFDASYGMNSPIKTYYLLAYIAMTLFFTAEVRVTLERTIPFWYAAFGVVCLCLTAGIGLSQTAIALHDTVGHGFSLIDSAVFACIALYTATRLFAFGAPIAADTAQAQPEEASDEEN